MTAVNAWCLPLAEGEPRAACERWHKTLLRGGPTELLCSEHLDEEGSGREFQEEAWGVKHSIGMENRTGALPVKEETQAEEMCDTVPPDGLKRLKVKEESRWILEMCGRCPPIVGCPVAGQYCSVSQSGPQAWEGAKLWTDCGFLGPNWETLQYRVTWGLESIPGSALHKAASSSKTSAASVPEVQYIQTFA